MPKPLRAPRVDNRLPLLLDAAARFFRAQGFHGASIRDIVRAVDMLPGSLYYHFAGKEDLLAAVYAEGVRRISARVTRGRRAEVRTVGAARSRLRRAPRVVARGKRLRAGGDPRAAGRRAGGRRASRRAARCLRAPVRRPDRGAAARARRRPFEPSPDAAWRAQLVAGLVPPGPRRPRRHRPPFRRFVASPPREGVIRGNPSQSSRHQDRPRRPRPGQPPRRRAPARRRHGGDLHAALAGHPGGGQARHRGGRRRHRRVLARDRPPDRTQARRRAAQRRADRRRRDRRRHRPGRGRGHAARRRRRASVPSGHRARRDRGVRPRRHGADPRRAVAV